MDKSPGREVELKFYLFHNIELLTRIMKGIQAHQDKEILLKELQLV